MSKFKVTSRNEGTQGDKTMVWAFLSNGKNNYSVTVANGVLVRAVVWIKPKNGWTQAHTRDVALTGKTGIAVKTALINARVIV